MPLNHALPRWLTVAGASISIVAASLITIPHATASTAEQPASEDLASRFSLGILPDTQFYSRYATEETGDLFNARFGSEPYDVQTAWLAEHANELNMPLVTHLGDVVDQAHVPAEWDVANAAMKNLEDANVPYSVLPGNHDLTSDGSTPYLDHFPTSRAAEQETFAGRSPDEHSEYHIFEAEGQKFLVLALMYHADDATLEWASEVLDQHPDLPTILTTHEYLGLDEERTQVTDTEYGQHLWNTLIADHDQIFMTLSGHNHGAGYRVQQNNAGHDVVDILMDYQMAYQGGNGLMGVLEFDLTNNRLQLEAFSPWVSVKPYETLTSFDDLLLPDEPDSWTLDFDFSERFADFNPDFTAGTPDEQPLADRAVSLVSQGYVPYEPEEADLPDNRNDYPEVDGTVAHWRPGDIDQEDGSVIGIGGVIPDITADQHFTRQEGINGATESDVTLSKSTHPLSSDGAAVCFANADKHFGGRDVSRLNYFTTDNDATINSETFDNGYTAETFIRVDETWSANRNPSMTAFGRMGERNNITQGGGMDMPVNLAFSDLQELQWSSMSNQLDSSSNWSHEVPKAEWVHVAVVNDPVEQTVTMYVDGAPILRNVINATGMQHDDGKPWILGAGLWGEELTDGWNGCVGETRLVTKPLEERQWLTARAATSAPPPSEQPSEEPSEGTKKPAEEPTNSTEQPTQEPTNSDTPSEQPTDSTTEPTAEPTSAESLATESPESDATEEVATSDNLARTGANVFWLIGAGVVAIALGIILTVVLRRRNVS
ncbi:LamG-like jellyroll fold domain-containing protein [Auritidibacter sp. NML120636]|uniref:LamG-like jellyroll fold domain-containing protein n=1 Tax=Auritidibacter sp. NML120636 TaxID=2170743 RepID=UPI00131404E5|nr:LamG-like jellyroll fold domain-containing protein [Auritidibacter sp. NML120636]